MFKVTWINYGVAKDRIEVYTPEFICAKAKLLGVNIVNYDYLREGREYFLKQVLVLFYHLRIQKVVI